MGLSGAWTGAEDSRERGAVWHHTRGPTALWRPTVLSAKGVRVRGGSLAEPRTSMQDLRAAALPRMALRGTAVKELALGGTTAGAAGQRAKG